MRNNGQMRRCWVIPGNRSDEFELFGKQNLYIQRYCLKIKRVPSLAFIHCYTRMHGRERSKMPFSCSKFYVSPLPMHIHNNETISKFRNGHIITAYAWRRTIKYWWPRRYLLWSGESLWKPFLKLFHTKLWVELIIY